MITVNISYVYHHNRGYLPHVEVCSCPPVEMQVLSGGSQQPVVSEHDRYQCASRFTQHGNREDITVVSGGQKFRVEQVQGEPYFKVHEHTLDVSLRLNGLTYETIAQDRGYSYIVV